MQIVQGWAVYCLYVYITLKIPPFTFVMRARTNFHVILLLLSKQCGSKSFEIQAENVSYWLIVLSINDLFSSPD